LGADANTLGSNVAAAPPKPPVAPKPNTGGGAGVSSFFSSTALTLWKGGTARVSDREGFDAVEWKWYRALASDALGTARSAGGGDRLRDLCAKNAEGNRPPAGFFWAGTTARSARPTDGRPRAELETHRSLGGGGVAHGASSIEWSVRTRGSECSRGEISRQPALFRSLVSVAVGSSAVSHKCASEGKVATLSRM
jgi:hypothetical protein